MRLEYAVALLRKLLANDDGLFGKAIATFFVRAVSAISAFGMNVAIARFLGVTGSGIFFLSLTIVLAASIITRFGLDNTLMRYVSVAWEQENYSRVLGISLQGWGLAGFNSALVGTILYISANWLAVHAFGNADLVYCIHIMAFSVLPLSMLFLLSGLLKAVRMPARAGIIEAGIVPLFVGGMLTIIALSGVKTTTETAAYIYLSATTIGTILGAFMFLKCIPSIAPPTFIKFNELLHSAYPLLWVDICNFTMNWSASLFLGFYSNAAEVGLYNVAQRTATLIVFILIVVNSITAPRFAALYNKGDIRELERLAVKTTMIMLFVALPVLLAIILYPKQILLIFGAHFVGGSVLLIIISLGQFVNVITGSVGYLLVMTGHERLMRNNLLFVSVLSFVLNIILVRFFGAVGAAYVTAISLIVQNITAAWLVYRYLGVCTIPGWRRVFFARRDTV